MESTKEIGERLKGLRAEKGVTQKEMAKDLNVSREMIGYWEAGDRDIKTQHTIALAKYFGVTCDEILLGVKSENVAIYRELGLSDRSIKTIKRLNFLNQTRNEILGFNMLDTVNLLFEDDGFDDFLWNVNYYLNSNVDGTTVLKFNPGPLVEEVTVKNSELMETVYLRRIIGLLERLRENSKAAP